MPGDDICYCYLFGVAGIPARTPGGKKLTANNLTGWFLKRQTGTRAIAVRYCTVFNREGLENCCFRDVLVMRLRISHKYRGPAEKNFGAAGIFGYVCQHKE
jgi:hypothetical protein